MLQAELRISFGFAIDERAEAELLNEAPKFPERCCALVQVDKVCPDAALREESQRLSRVRALFDPEDLNFHRLHRLVIDREPPCQRGP